MSVFKKIFTYKKCDSCKNKFNKDEMILGVMISVHYPWNLCKNCYYKIIKKENK